jgi:hypothetical protein
LTVEGYTNAATITEGIKVLKGQRLMASHGAIGWRLTRICTWVTTPHGLGWPKKGSDTIQPIIQKILEGHVLLPKA